VLEGRTNVPTRPRIVVIGAGAAGVFTAYQLRALAGDANEIVLVERSGRVGGNAQSTNVQYGGRTYSVDCGAQFFYKNAQPSYVELLGDLGLLSGSPEIEARATGITLWDRSAGEPLLWLPSHLDGFLRYRARDWTRVVGFSAFLAYASLLDRESPRNWTLTVDDWVSRLTLIDNQFKDEVLRTFLYQFVTMPRQRIGEASALYAITYFVRNLLGEPGSEGPHPGLTDPAGAETFQVYQSRIGLDGVLARALESAGVTPRLNESVTAVLKQANGSLAVETSSETIPADHVVFAIDPQSAAAILISGAYPAPDLIASLQACEYADLQISMQDGGSCWMPGEARYWEAVNTVVDGDALQFTTWFGPLRDPYDGNKRIPVFKSWGAPDLDPSLCAHTFFSHAHRILMPTTDFMRRRQEVLTHQGTDHVWFTGGWTNWFDSQEAALDSATRVAEQLTGVPAMASRRRAVPASPDRHRQWVDRWIARLAARAPADERITLTTLMKEIETRG
jgi:predicted NAD/FAD-binding protein